KVVRVRLNRDDVHGGGQRVAIADDVVASAGRNVDRLAAEAQPDWRTRRRRVSEVEARRGLDGLGLAGRLQGQLHDQIAARLEAPLRAFRDGVRGLTRRPPE